MNLISPSFLISLKAMVGVPTQMSFLAKDPPNFTSDKKC